MPIQPLGTHLDDLQEFQAFVLQALNANAALLALGQLRLLDHLDDTPKSAAEIAAASGLNPGKLLRLLRFLASQQVIECNEDEGFCHTRRSRLLQTYQSGLQFLREAMGAAPGLAQCLASDRPAFDCSFGMPVFDYLAQHPEAERYFGELMNRTTAIAEAFIFANHSFEPFRLAVDVGGSHGSLMLALLSRHEEARGVVFDQPGTAKLAGEKIAGSKLAGRIEARGGDFFESVPAGGDLYILKQILHDWEDEDCVKILRSIRRAIANEGRLAVIEYLLPTAQLHHPGFAMDMHMMVLSTGRERTRSEYEVLLEAAGFRLDRVTDNPAGQSVAEAVPL